MAAQCNFIYLSLFYLSHIFRGASLLLKADEDLISHDDIKFDWIIIYLKYAIRLMIKDVRKQIPIDIVLVAMSTSYLNPFSIVHYLLISTLSSVLVVRSVLPKYDFLKY